MAETMERVTVTIPRTDRDLLRALGDGNASAGTRKACEVVRRRSAESERIMGLVGQDGSGCILGPTAEGGRPCETVS